MVKKPPTMQETCVLSLSREDPLEEGMTTHSSILAWRISLERSLAGYSPWGHTGSETIKQLDNIRVCVCVCVCVCVGGVLSCSVVSVFVIPWTVAHQAPLSIGFARQEN